MLKLDYTRESVVVVCDLCPNYGDLALDRAEGWALANRHERAEHPDLDQASKNAAKARSSQR